MSPGGTTTNEQTREDRATQPLGCWKGEFRNLMYVEKGTLLLLVAVNLKGLLWNEDQCLKYIQGKGMNRRARRGNAELMRDTITTHSATNTPFPNLLDLLSSSN